MHPDVAALLAVQDDDAIIDDLETRLAELRPRLDAMATEHDKAVAASAAGAQDRRVRGASAPGRRGARRTAPRAAGQESDGAQQRHVDARGDGGDGAARAGQAHDRRGRARARRRSASVSSKRTVSSTERERIATELETAQAQARASLVGRSEADRERAGRRSQRSAKRRRAKFRARCCRSTIASARASASTRSSRSAATRAAIATRRFRCSGAASCRATGGTEVCEGCGVMLYAAD